MEIIIREWINEDEMTEDDMYKALFNLSRVDFVRVFPKVIEVVDNSAINQWILGIDTGISSKTLWMAMKGIEPTPNMMIDIPHDADDFGRCFRLMMISNYEQRQKALENVGKICPAFIPIAREWTKLEELYVKSSQEGNYTVFHSYLSVLKQEGEKHE